MWNELEKESLGISISNPLGNLCHGDEKTGTPHLNGVWAATGLDDPQQHPYIHIYSLEAF